MLSTCFRICLLFITTFMLSAFGHAQVTNPDWNEAYVQDVVPTFEITMDPADYTWMLEQANLSNNNYLEASFVYTDSDGNTHNYSGSGVRLRGNTSRFAKKKSFKINVDKFGGADKFYGYDKINLKGSHNDPSILRERLGYYFMREMGGAAPLVNNVKVFINGEYKGIYVNFEQIDDDFMKSRFGNKDGNLYKCLYGASLRTNDDVWNNDVFELETNENENDRSDLIELIDVLNNTSNEEFQLEIEKILDVKHLLKYLAVEVLIGHWDGYSFNKNNYYLYHNTDTDKFEVIMYDCDNTFGIDWFGEDWGTRDVYNWGQTSEDRPMFWRVLDVPDYRAQFTNNVLSMLDGEFNSSIFPWIDQLLAQNQEAALADTFRTLDYGFDSTSYALSTSEAFGAHVKYGIKPFIEQRSATARQQLDWTTGISMSSASQSQSKFHATDGVLRVWNTKPAKAILGARLVGMDGRIVRSMQDQNSANPQITFQGLKPGVYLVLLESLYGESRLKVVVN